MPSENREGESHRSKAEQLLDSAEENVFTPPEYDHSPGWCKECDEEVVIDMGLRPWGMAESCEDHLPLCRFQEGSRHG